ncbi:MAG: DNRLRE domain-containing protein [Gemmatimonadales bacterium]
MSEIPHRGASRRRTAPSLAVLALIAAASPAAAQLPTPTPKAIRIATIEANADARVQGGAPDVNYPTGNLWLGLQDKRSFLHFDLDPIPAGATIMEAELLLTFIDSYSEQGPNTIRLGGVRGQWRENTLTYANQPSVAWSGRSVTVSAPGLARFDVRPAVTAWMSGQHPNRGFALQGDGPLKNAYSREAPSSTDRPRLRVKYVEP